jgi:putative ABC transport system permease protein
MSDPLPGDPCPRRRFLPDLHQDLQVAVRRLAAAPGFSVAVVATLALAIGATTALFGVVTAVLLRPLPFRDPDAVVMIWSRQTARDQAPFNLPDFIDLRDGNDVLEQMAGIASWSATLTGEGEPQRLQGLRVSGNLFDLLHAGAQAGRPLVAADERPGAERVVVLTDAAWRVRFGASPSVIGRRLALDGEGYTVKGVLPPDLLLPARDVDVVAALAPDTDPLRAERGSIAFVRVVGRLRPGVAPARAEEALTAIAARLRREHPDTNARKIGVRIVPYAEEIVGSFRASLLALFGMVGAVLLVACANLASLFLAQGAARRTEMAARLALGATRGRLARQLLTEVAAYALLGGAGGAVLAWGGIRLLRAMAPADLPRRGDIRLDLATLLFSVVVTLLAAIVVGTAPALFASGTRVVDGLKATARGSSAGRGQRRALSWLVTLEVAAALVLLVLAGLLGRTFVRLAAVDPGFDPQGALAARVSLAGGGFAGRDAIVAYQGRVLEQLRALPVVEAAGAVSILPLSGSMVRIDFTVEGGATERQDVPTAQYRMVTPGYFAAMRVPLRRGRALRDADGATAAPVALVNATLAHRLFGAADPIGAHLLIDDNNGSPRPVAIVGVVGDVTQVSLEGVATNDLYLPYAQLHPDNLQLAAANMTWVVRTRVDPDATARAIGDALRRAAAGVPIAGIAPLGTTLSAALAPRRFTLGLMTLFAFAAVLLAATGTYAVLSFATHQRLDELAIRRALGAGPRQILWLVVGQGMRPVAAGIVFGLAAATALTGLVASMLFGVGANDPLTFGAVACGLGLVAALACLVPAVRAARDGRSRSRLFA